MKKQIYWACLIALCAVLVLPAMAEDYPHQLPWNNSIYSSSHEPTGNGRTASIPWFDNDDVAVECESWCTGGGDAESTVRVSVIMSEDHVWYFDTGQSSDPSFDESSEDHDDYMSLYWDSDTGETASSAQLIVDIESN